MTIVLVISARDVREHLHLFDRQQPVRDRDAEHVRVALHIQAVHQAQRQEFGFSEFSVEASLDLSAKLRDALVHHLLIDLVVNVHRVLCPKLYERA